MKKILSLLIAFVALSATSADKSIIIDGKILNSKFYPGTVHEYKVYSVTPPDLAYFSP